MSDSTYITSAGDTFESISRNTSGTENAAAAIAAANPGATEPFIGGIVLFVPPVAGAPTDKLQQTPSDDPNTVTIQINNKRFVHWVSIEITQRTDSISTFSLQAALTTEDDEFKENFKPFTYNKIQINIGSQVLFTGTIVDVDPFLDPDSRIIGASGYSTPGVLSDCTAPVPKGNFQLEFDGLTAVDIANAILLPFGIEAVSLNGDSGAVIEQTAIEPQETILPYLTKIAKQANLVISSTPTGQLLFQKADGDGNQVVANYVQGEPGLINVAPNFRPQNYFSHVSGMGQTLVGLLGIPYTEVNKRLTGTLRPFTYIVPDMDEADVVEAVKSKIGRMFANAVSYTISVPTWRDSFGNLWEPNTFINVTAPGAMIYKKYKFLIRGVTFSRAPETEIAFLDLIIPGTFSGKIPESLPWDD